MNRREKIESRLAEDPDDPFLNYTYAMELAKLGEVEQAQQSFRKVRQLDANYVPAYFQEGQMLAHSGRIEEAQALLRAGIAVARQIGDSHALGEMTDFLDSLSGSL